MRPFLTSVIRYVESWLFQRKPESKALHCVIPIFDFRSNKKGFTLIELVIFIVVGAIILPASFVAFTAAIKHFSTPDYYVKAKFYAEQRMEEVTSNAYAAIGVTSGTVIGTSPETGFQRSWNICYVLSLTPDQCASDQTTDSNYKKIVVSIITPDNSTYDVSTIVTRRPKS